MKSIKNLKKFKVEEPKVLSTHLPDVTKHTDNTEAGFENSATKALFKISLNAHRIKDQTIKNKIFLRVIVYVLSVEKYNKLTNLL